MQNYIGRLEREGIRRVKMFVIMLVAYLVFWGPLFSVTLLQPSEYSQTSEFVIISGNQFRTLLSLSALLSSEIAHLFFLSELNLDSLKISFSLILSFFFFPPFDLSAS